jgi:hypothetical protein
MKFKCGHSPAGERGEQVRAKTACGFSNGTQVSGKDGDYSGGTVYWDWW